MSTDATRNYKLHVKKILLLAVYLGKKGSKCLLSITELRMHTQTQLRVVAKSYFFLLMKTGLFPFHGLKEYK